MDGRLKDIQRLIKKIDRLTDGQAYVSLDHVDWDNVDLQDFNSFLLVVRPNGGYYEGGKFEFRVTLPLDYPCECPPVIWCNTPVYHPNIDMEEQLYFDDTSTNVCLNLFDYGTWQPSFTLEVMVLGLIFLFHHPNLDDPLANGFSELTDIDQFAANVRKYMAGEEVNDIKYNTGFRVIDGVMVEEWDPLKSKGDTNELKTVRDSGFELSDICELEHSSPKSDSIEDVVKNDSKDTTAHDKEQDIIHNSATTNSSDPIFENDNDKLCSDVETQLSTINELKSDTDNLSIKQADVDVVSTDKLEHLTTDKVTVCFKDEQCPSSTIREDMRNAFQDQEVDQDDGDVECVIVNGEFVVKPKMIHIEEEDVLESIDKSTNTFVIPVDDLDSDRKTFDPNINMGSHRKPRNFFSCVRRVLNLISRAFRRRR